MTPQKSELDRVEEAIEAGDIQEMRRWQEKMKQRFFDCTFAGDRAEFKRLVGNAYMKFPQCREEIWFIRENWDW